jgi:hypothetical protein
MGAPPVPTPAASSAAPAAAAGAAHGAEAEAFEDWASRQRRRAARDGAWKVEVTERVVDGNITRSVASWHDNTVQTGRAPLRRSRQHGRGTPARRPQQQVASRDQQPVPTQQSSRQRRSNLRSVAHHRKARWRALRRCLLAVRFLARLSRLTAIARALRDEPSPGKRRRSPLPPETACGPIRLWTPDSLVLPPPPKRAESQGSWFERALSRVQRARDG